MWPKIAPNQSEQWQRPSLENRFCFLKFFQLFWVDLSRSEKFQSTVADFWLRRQVFDSWQQSAKH